MKLLSWNVNGIRSILKKGFLDFIRKEQPDILCLQETRAPLQTLDLELADYKPYWNCATKPGYSGTAMFTRIAPLQVTCGMEMEKHDQEGRILTAEFEPFYLVNVYVPNAKRDLARLPYRHKEWDVDFLKYLKKLEKKKPVIFCGDLNVAHKEIDLTHPRANVGNHGFTPEEREGFDNLLQAGFVDSFREFNQDGGHYTWWSQMNRCRERNIGWRIDYFCLSSSIRNHLKGAFILKDVMGSDHCPVGITLNGWDHK